MGIEEHFFTVWFGKHATSSKYFEINNTYRQVSLIFKILFFRAFLFGGVQDLEDDDDDDDEDASGQFFNELFSLQVDNDKASWQKSKDSLITKVILT